MPLYLIDAKTDELVIPVSALRKAARDHMGTSLENGWLDARMQGLGWVRIVIDGHEQSGRLGRKGLHSIVEAYRGDATGVSGVTLAGAASLETVGHLVTAGWPYSVRGDQVTNRFLCKPRARRHSRFSRVVAWECLVTWSPVPLALLGLLTERTGALPVSHVMAPWRRRTGEPAARPSGGGQKGLEAPPLNYEHHWRCRRNI